MRELILKFKHWLIKKLGGYTEQRVDNRRVEFRTHHLRPMKLMTEMRADPYSMLCGVSEQEMFTRFKRECAYQLADKIVQDDLFIVTCCDDIVRNERIYRAELNIIHPHDVAMCMF